MTRGQYTVNDIRTQPPLRKVTPNDRPNRPCRRGTEDADDAHQRVGQG
jgi:hypothetical protein